MVALNHALTGAVVAAAINRPALALPAAFLSHFATDALPHWNYQIPGHKALRPIVIGVDMLAGTALLAVLALSFSESPWVIFVAGLLAISPDFMWAPYILYGKESPRSKNTPLHIARRFHMRIQWSETSTGGLVELAWLVLMLWAFFAVAG